MSANEVNTNKVISAGALSFLFPGLGQLSNGDKGTAIGFIGATVFLEVMSFVALFPTLGWTFVPKTPVPALLAWLSGSGRLIINYPILFVWTLNIYEAVRSARKKAKKNSP